MELLGQHAILSASQSEWLFKDKATFGKWYKNKRASERGTRLHELAKNHIELGVPMEEGSTKTFDAFVNDAIIFGMTPEQPIKPFADSLLAFGTADAISFDEETGKLMIFDLKTGDHPAKMRQLKVYAAFFCLENDIDPRDIDIQLRIYQTDNIIFSFPDPFEILSIMQDTKDKKEWIEEFEAE